MTPKFHALRIADVKQETEDTVSIAFEIPTELIPDYQFKSGQYLTLKSMIDNEDVRRSYSLCSAPFENEWRVAIKSIEHGKFSNFANKKLKIGDVMEVMTPTGHFNLSTDPTSEKSYVLFAAGSGVTPIISMAKSILAEEPKSDVTLFYGNKNFGSIIFREELEALKNEYMNRLRIVHILSRESLGNTIQKGRIDKEKVEKLIKAFLTGVNLSGIYICGPESMIHAVKDAFVENGILENLIHFELFTASTPIKAKEVSNEPKVESNVSIILDGDHIDLVLNSSDENILDAALKAGADLPFACKGGVCCTCKAKIIEGTARMDVNYALDKEEVAAGFILTCQAHPTSEKLIVSFDE